MRASLVEPDVPVVWVTADCLQSRSVLAGEQNVVYLPRVDSRDYVALFRVLIPALRLLVRHRPRAVYSTGAAVALAFLPFAWLVGARATYVESAARTSGPSHTGKILSALPWIRLRTQYRGWAGTRWQYAGSVFDGYEPVRVERPDPRVRKVVVTLGTQENFPFVTLVERLNQIVPPGTEVLWQIGGGFPPDARPQGARESVPMAELCAWVNDADAVIAHAGVGSALTLLEQGFTPLLVPRSADRGEHIDEHQRLIADELEARGLAVTAEADRLTWADVVRSTSTRVRPLHRLPSSLSGQPDAFTAHDRLDMSTFTSGAA
ncbi:MAG TPA: glycosyltransferase [Jatrophihabitans sp.]|nr:glycosyltransferase [Jatrophihabitans sp.]